MRLRYDKNFHTEQVRSFPKYYGQELQGRIERAIQPKHNPILLKPRIAVKVIYFSENNAYYTHLKKTGPIIFKKLQKKIKSIVLSQLFL